MLYNLLNTLVYTLTLLLIVRVSTGLIHSLNQTLSTLFFCLLRKGKYINTKNMNTQIEFTRVNNDTNGNPRYVCHFLNLLSNTEQKDITSKARPFESISDMYREAVNKASEIGGKKYHNKQYGGGIVFQSYNIADTEKSILNLLKD